LTTCCALLAAWRHEFGPQIALCCPGLEFVTPTPSSLEALEVPNPFGLAEGDRADAVLISKSWYDWLATQHPNRLDRVLDELEQRWGVLVGVDGRDDFALGFPPSVVRRFAAVIKPQGVFRDRDLYNWVVGSMYPDAVWAEKKRPREARYSESDLEKVKLSVPCFMLDLPAIRREARQRETAEATQTIGRRMSPLERAGRDLGEASFLRAMSLAPVGRRRLEVNCVGSLTHVQRVDAIRFLEGYSGRRCITGAFDFVAGMGETIDSNAFKAILASASRYRCAPQSRPRYLLDLCRHRVVVAPAGLGELTYRHAEAWRAGAALVCPNLSHVEMMFPVQDGENATFCQPDLSDLRRVVDDLLREEGLRAHIARSGRRDFAVWQARWREHLSSGIEAHILHALS
jgi:hypothetical protein